MKKALIVIDYQKDFVDGSLGFPKAKTLEPNICRKISAYLEQGNDLLFTLDTHNEDYLSTEEGKSLPVPHCRRDSRGWELSGQVAAFLPRAVKVFEKETFGSVELARYVQENGYDAVELVGLVSNICVLSNAVLIKAFSPEIQIVIDAACTASFDDELNAKALDVLQGVHMTVINRA